MTRSNVKSSVASSPSLPRSIKALGEAYEAGTLAPVKVAKSFLARIERVNPALNCFITVLADSALEAARQSEARFREGSQLGPLDGVPVAVKDIIYIKGVKCTAGSKILAENVAGYDSPVVRKLKAAGAVIIGTTNLHEVAAGVTSDNPHYGPVRNPWDPGRIAGGSSGGSAAAVAANLASGALGTDTAGSVRIPAALCGVLGLKPTYGRVSRLGVIPLASSLDTVGTINNGAWDAASMLQVIAGHDAEDMTTTDAEVPDYTGELRKPFEAPRVGVPKKYFHDLLHRGVVNAFDGFLDRLTQLGCKVENVELEGIEEAYSRWLPIRRAEATAFHLRWLETVPELYGADVRRLLELGKEISAVEYVTAISAMPALMQRFGSSIQDFDALAIPTTCVPAPLIGKSTVMIRDQEVDTYTALNRLTLPFNYVGFPALSVPAGLVDGLPVGVQLVGKLFDEATIIRVADAYESRFGPHPPPP
jgi:aspartyl-tRNA(Asn)/glutamyl-tRNA(Gln) amidotransferase subunit A